MENIKCRQKTNDSFCIRESRFEPEFFGRNESVFTLGNGSLGFRGDFEEGISGGTEGVYLNGFYDTAPIQYGESAYGYAKNAQTMLNLANAKRIRIFLDDEEVSLDQGQVEAYERVLHMEEGRQVRSFVWHSPKGRSARVTFERMVSLEGKDIAYIGCEVEPLSGITCISMESAIDGSVENVEASDDPRVGSNLGEDTLTTVWQQAAGDTCRMAQKTGRSNLAYGCAVKHVFIGEDAVEEAPYEREREVGIRYTCRPFGKLVLEKWIAYVRETGEEARKLAEEAKVQAEEAAKRGAAALRELQRSAMDTFWSHTGLDIQGDEYLLQGLRFSLFQLYQSAGRDGKTNIAAKGLSGEGYEGHYFWDTETYIFPLFLYTMPEIAKSLLCYRYSILDKARQRAREMAHEKGALFPWRTIGGEECSAYYPAGTAQYHINADIANAVLQYAQVTGDEDFMADYGVEILVETARLWEDLGFYNEEKGGSFCIHGVTGPDEYNVLVNNNCYTNLMAAYNMREAAHWMEWLEKEQPQKAKALAKRIGLAEEEPKNWRQAAAKMYLPYDEKRKMHMQDDSFAERIPWPLDTIPKENFPLLLNYHPLVIYRHQVCKQADLVLALLLRSEEFSLEEKKRIFDYYEPFTTHDSSLSRAIFGIIASEIGYPEKAYDYFGGAARLDLEDMHGNSKDGLHMASMAGAWMSVVYGFAGMRAEKGALAFHPRLPKQWESYRFCVGWQGKRIQVSIERERTSYQLLEGEAITISHFGQEVCLTGQEMVSVENF